MKRPNLTLSAISCFYFQRPLLEMFIKLSISSILLFFSFQFVFGQETRSSRILSLGVLNDKAKILVLPKYPNEEVRVAGSVSVLVKIDLQKGEVVSTSAVSGHPLFRASAVTAAKKAKFEPVLTEFNTIYGTGILIYKIEDFTNKVIENKKPKPLLPILDYKTAIINGKAVKLEKPEYSELARNACAAGKVEVFTLIHSGSGEVIAAKAISGNELLWAASEEAVMKSKFISGNIDGNNDFYMLSKIVYNFNSFAKCIGVGVVNKRAITIPKPIVNIFPKKEFSVVVQIGVDESGKVIYAKALSGQPLYRAACEKSAKQAEFTPPAVDGPPVKIRALLVYKFKPDGTIEF